ncbi:hypothetical protein CYMTET_29829 [Cymbomonas tetramitiformis]|uniref:Uncharacterized protein n=1 Tax=Cymbomonas tetramitiformis TaxID=36881 RepID=A0AAE0KUI7_9CHLO|nr:hypothetical protein CYMTET_29829 [Cymbomonas tetramitiformis]
MLEHVDVSPSDRMLKQIEIVHAKQILYPSWVEQGEAIPKLYPVVYGSKLTHTSLESEEISATAPQFACQVPNLALH